MYLDVSILSYNFNVVLQIFPYQVSIPSSFSIIIVLLYLSLFPINTTIPFSIFGTKYFSSTSNLAPSSYEYIFLYLIFSLNTATGLVFSFSIDIPPKYLLYKFLNY